MNLDEKTAFRRPKTIARLGRVVGGHFELTHIVGRVYRMTYILSTFSPLLFSCTQNSKTTRLHKGFLVVCNKERRLVSGITKNHSG